MALPPWRAHQVHSFPAMPSPQWPITWSLPAARSQWPGRAPKHAANSRVITRSLQLQEKRESSLWGTLFFHGRCAGMYPQVLTPAPVVRANEALLAYQAVEVEGTNGSQNQQSANGQATHAHWWRQALYLTHGDFNESSGVRRN